MKKNLEILEFEDKETQAGKSYVRFKTDIGWLSCFDKKANESLKKLKGKKAEVEVISSGNFSNIKKFYGEGDNQSEDEKEIEIIRPERESYNFGAMHTSYAKDILIALIARISQQKFDEIGEQKVQELMDMAIRAVEKARSKFEG